MNNYRSDKIQANLNYIIQYLFINAEFRLILYWNNVFLLYS